jgi:hypothetical protein
LQLCSVILSGCQVAARQQYETETAELKQQLSELTAFKHTKERMERQISELLLEVQELKVSPGP